uniref:Uncharacterized protein n=1 Tax=Magallana gigas TaxID=29159 RepID=K1RNP5_MAGGI
MAELAISVIYVSDKTLRCTERARNEDFVEQQLFFRIEKEDTLESPTTMRDEDENINDTRRSDVQRKKLDEENSAANAPGVCIDSDKSDNEEGDTQELTDVFDDTMESIQRIAHPTEEQDRELCTKLYNLLEIEGRKLMQEFMAATLTRETGKSVETLINKRNFVMEGTRGRTSGLI